MDPQEWLENARAWHGWLATAILLAGAELLSLDLILLMLAMGAVVGTLVAVIGLPFAVQLLAAVGASVAMLALVRPSIVKRLHSGPELRLGHTALVGKRAVVVERVSDQGGQVRIGGELWSARAYDESEVIDAGATVDVFEIRGATALVHPVPMLEA